MHHTDVPSSTRTLHKNQGKHISEDIQQSESPRPAKKMRAATMEQQETTQLRAFGAASMEPDAGRHALNVGTLSSLPSGPHEIAAQTLPLATTSGIPGAVIQQQQLMPPFVQQLVRTTQPFAMNGPEAPAPGVLRPTGSGITGPHAFAMGVAPNAPSNIFSNWTPQMIAAYAAVLQSTMATGGAGSSVTGSIIPPMTMYQGGLGTSVQNAAPLLQLPVYYTTPPTHPTEQQEHGNNL